MKVYLDSVGCRLNQSEMETLARQLLAAGHEIVSNAGDAEKVVINTCAVTRQAAKDSRALTRRLHRQNDGAEIILTGCYATISPDKMAEVDGAGRIVANRSKDQLLQIVDPSASLDLPVYDREPVLREFLAGSSGNTRTFVKVQDGCDNRCTFCVTTVARGEGRSRQLGDVVAEVQGLAASGYQEAVLTGVHLGSYGRDLDHGASLGELVIAILNHTDIARLRLSSLEPWDIADDFFALWENPRLLPHLHVPLQSGSDRILQRMARRTTRDNFRRLAATARTHIPDLNLSTDLIAGFPGESEAEHRETLDFVAEIGFSRLHVFSYSRRPGTAAARMDGQIPKPIRKQRGRELIALGKQLSLAFHRRFEGQTRPVLWESVIGADSGDQRWAGYTDNYIRIKTNGPANLFNRVTETHLAGANSDGMTGTVVPSQTPKTICPIGPTS